MANVETDKIKALKKHWDQFKCEHESTKLRKRTVKGGLIQYVQQCQRCGRAVSRAIAKQEAIHQNGGTEPEPFDESLQKQWEQQSSEGAKKIIGKYESIGKFQKAEFDKWYAEYLDSDIWKNKKNKVIQRAGGICEGCREKEATVVHHLTYRDVGDEFLFQLVALCHGCHHRYHESHPEEEI